MPDPVTQDRPLSAQLASAEFSEARGQPSERQWGQFGGVAPGTVWCAVNYRAGEMHVYWGVGRRAFGAGAWSIALVVNDQPFGAPARWEEVCRESEDGVEYLELEGRAAKGIQVTRHLLVAPKDGFLLAADAVVFSRPVTLHYSAVWPLGRDVSCEPAAHTRETRLTFGRRRAVVLPLALPEWREDSRGGELVPSEAGLALRQWTKGRALFAPLFIDVDPKRQNKPLTWRTLTVAENFRVQPPDMAVGYRVQIGSRQWLVYRSLGPKGNRSLLGHNLVSETLVARFVGGQVEPLLEIE